MLNKYLSSTVLNTEDRAETSSCKSCPLGVFSPLTDSKQINGMTSGGDEAGPGVNVVGCVEEGWGPFETALVREGLAESELRAVWE